MAGDARLPRRVGIVGLGLMGASLARGIRAVDPSVHLAAAESAAAVRDRAVADGVVDEVHEGPVGPVSALMPTGAVLTDVGGAKERVVAVARRDGDPRVPFVGAHPMFGGRGGYEGARADRWRGGTVAVC